MIYWDKGLESLGGLLWMKQSFGNAASMDYM